MEGERHKADDENLEEAVLEWIIDMCTVGFTRHNQGGVYFTS